MCSTREPFWIFTHLGSTTNSHNFKFRIPDNERRGYAYRVAFFESGSEEIEPNGLHFVDNAKLSGEWEGTSLWSWIHYHQGRFKDGDYDDYFEHPREFYSLYGFLMYPE